MKWTGQSQKVTLPMDLVIELYKYSKVVYHTGHADASVLPDAIQACAIVLAGA